MKYTLLLITVFGIISLQAQSAIAPTGIDIVRDSFGVPHIFANTDAEVAYGLAWAHAEDNFKIIQQGALAGKKMLGRYSGKSGAAIDYVVHLIQAEELVKSRYDSDISAPFKKVLEGYCAGINAYAAKHPAEVLHKDLFPLTPQNMLTYTALQLFVSCGGDEALQQIVAGKMPVLEQLKMGGSNSHAFNSKKTTDGAVYLNINSHQPLEGPVSWYEAHLHSNEGWNILGAMFPGGPSVFIGCNESLGWSHTVNNPDKLDVFQLQINPQNKLQYLFDGKWESLTEKSVKLKVKVAGIVITVKKKIYASKYGPTYIAANGTFSIRTGALFSIRALEQWYWMNKASNFSQFYKALEIQGIPGYNVVYADKFDTIFYLSNGLMPFRNKKYNWQGTVAGNTSETLWQEFHPIKDLPQVLNPPSGYVFNSNNTPFNATAPGYNIKNEDYDPTMGYETYDNNRSLRFMELIEDKEKITYNEFKRIKFDVQLPKKLAYRINFDTLFLLNPAQYGQIADLIQTLKIWDRKGNVESKGAAVFCIMYYYVVNRLRIDWKNVKTLTVAQCLEAFQHAQAYLKTNFGTEEVTLGQYQVLVRGKKTLPLFGMPDVIAAMYSGPYEKGKVKGEQGDSYIELVKFTKSGPEIESINCYGASNRPGSKHYDDQMERFTQQRPRKMSLDKKTVYDSAERIYHPQ